jgi:hypothetical protein
MPKVRRIMKGSTSFRVDQIRSLPRSIFEDRLRAYWASARIPWSQVRRMLLIPATIYLIGGAIIFNVQLLEFLDWATPMTVASAALLIALLAKLVIRDEL